VIHDFGAPAQSASLSNERGTVASKVSIIVASLLFLGTLILYLCCAAPSVLFGDGGEFQTIGLIGGVAHPTGYPTYIMVGQVFGRLLGGEPARRMNVMSAFFAAASVCFLFFIQQKLGLSQALAVGGSLIYATSFTFWWSAIQAEVATVSIFFFLASLWFSLRALERPTIDRIALAGFSLGIVLTGHFAFAPAIVAMGILLILRKPIDGTPRQVCISLFAISFVMGLVPYLYLVWIGHGNHPMDYVKYTIEPKAGQFGATEKAFDNPWGRILWLFSGKQIRPEFYFTDPRGVARNLAHILLIEFVYHYGPFAVPFFAWGAWQSARKRSAKRFMILGILSASLLFCMVVNYGRMQQIFMMPLTIASAILITFGISSGMHILFDKSMNAPRLRVIAGVMIFTTIILTPHLLRVGAERSRRLPPKWKMPIEVAQMRGAVSLVPNLRGYLGPRMYGMRALELIPPNALVVCNFWEFTVLANLHYVEKRRPDITLELGFPEHLMHLMEWEKNNDLATCPIVFTREIPELMEHFPAEEIREVTEEYKLYIHWRKQEHETHANHLKR
jgi:hypothetical protein